MKEMEMEREIEGSFSTHTLAKDTSKTLLLHPKSTKEEESRKSINMQFIYSHEREIREGVERNLPKWV